MCFHGIYYVAGYILEAKLAWGELPTVAEFSIRLTRLKRGVFSNSSGTPNLSNTTFFSVHLYCIRSARHGMLRRKAGAHRAPRS